MVYMVFPAVLAALLQLRRLVDLVDQFAIVLTAMPFVSVETKAKAIASLKGFNADDVKKARLEKRNVKNEKSLEDFSEDIFLKIGGFFIDVYWISTDVYTNRFFYFSYHLNTKSLGNREIFRITQAWQEWGNHSAPSNVSILWALGLKHFFHPKMGWWFDMTNDQDASGTLRVPAMEHQHIF